MSEPRDDELVARLKDYLAGYARYPRHGGEGARTRHRLRTLTVNCVAAAAVIGTLVAAYAVGHSHTASQPVSHRAAPGAAATPPPTATAATSSPVPPCVPTSFPPRPSRQVFPADLSNGVHLGAVAPGVRPRLSATAALARLSQWYQPGAGNCGLTETLASWSSDNPATVPPECVPPANLTTPWAAPSNCPATPIYQHILAWVFEWRTDCHSSGPAAPVGTTFLPRPTLPPLACTAITFVDATTGATGDLTEGSG
jgi:hypothetical protein